MSIHYSMSTVLVMLRKSRGPLPWIQQEFKFYQQITKV